MDLGIPIASSRDVAHFAGKLCARRIVLPSSDEQRGRDSLVFLLSECGVAVALEYFASFQIEMKPPLRYHIERYVELVV
jgi:hypothetical protein